MMQNSSLAKQFPEFIYMSKIAQAPWPAPLPVS